MSEVELRQEMVRVCRTMNERGLNQGSSGNLSARVSGGMLITPSAVPYEELGPGDLLRLDLEGRILEGAARPSTEWRIHAAVLKDRPEAGAVLHAHPPFCTALACLRLAIPAFHYMVAVAGGDSIRCAPYATFGSPALAAGVRAALEERTACLLANHGMVALAASPSGALELATEVETLAAQYGRALQIGTPAILTAAEMADVRKAFRDYRS
ncbi:MAG: class II aldolase/adducin family protein [Gemmatimonadota bacterium]